MARKTYYDFGGVRPGGLTDENDIRILICFLLKSIEGGLTKEQLEVIIRDDDRVSYFNYLAAMDSIQDSHFLIKQDDRYTITSAGSEACTLLKDTLPRSVRDAVLARAVAVLRHERILSENSAEAVVQDGETKLVCQSSEGGKSVLQFALDVDNPEIAKALASQYLKQPELIYKALFCALTDDFKGLTKVVADLKEQSEKEL